MKFFIYNKYILFVEFLITIPFMWQAFNHIPILKKGGYVMLPLSYCLLFSIVIAVERFIFLKKIGHNSKKILKNISDSTQTNSNEDIIVYCNKYPSPTSEIIKTAISRKDQSEEKIREIIEETGSLELHKLQMNLDYLSLLERISPLLGLLGTVTGLLNAFNELVKLSANISATVFAGGIAEALLTTIYGLCIAIPALVFHQYFTQKVKNIVYQMEKSASIIIIKVAQTPVLKKIDTSK